MLQTKPQQEFMASRYQTAVFDFVQYGTGNGLVNAVAGSGKTTTLIHAAKYATGSVLFVAFNKVIAETMRTRLNGFGEAQTLHSVGLQTVQQVIEKPVIKADKYRKLLYTNRQNWGVKFNETGEVLALAEMARVTLTPESGLLTLARERDLTANADIVAAVKLLLRAGLDVAERLGEIDFTDMLWLVAKWNLQPKQYAWLLVDECQDLNAAQQDLARKLTDGRMLCVGDPAQAIYAFAGADADSFNTLRTSTNARELPLSICYRCPASHLELAREIVPSIEARPDAPKGELLADGRLDYLLENIAYDDLIICRRNAALLSTCLELIKRGWAARIRGRDIGQQLARTVQDVGGNAPIAEFPRLLFAWRERQAEKLIAQDASETAQQALSDKYDCLLVCWDKFAAQVTDGNGLAVKIAELFDDNSSARRVWLSSIHRAKGLEAERVWILESSRLGSGWPKQSPRELAQEINLRYVALTRARRSLFLVN